MDMNIVCLDLEGEQVAIRPEMILLADHDTDMVEEAYEMTGIV